MARCAIWGWGLLCFRTTACLYLYYFWVRFCGTKLHFICRTENAYLMNHSTIQHNSIQCVCVYCTMHCSTVFVLYVVQYSCCLVYIGMSQIPRGDSSDFVVQFTYKTSQRDTFQRFVDELYTFVDGKYTLRYIRSVG